MQEPGPGGQGQQPGGPSPSWQAPPPAAPPPAAPPPGGGAPPAGGTWTANLTSQAPVAGPAGYIYADVPNRAIAYIVDAIILFVFLFVIGFITTAIFGVDTVIGKLPSTTSLIVSSILWAAATAAYFVYTWVTMRGTPGMKLLGMQIGNESNGGTLTYNQALLRYAVLFGPAILANLLGAFLPGLGLILQLLAFVWFIVLLVTTAQSPTKQGIHDKQAHTMVVKAARSAA
jgi:uncharacterized RDD family membrane protein YckC